MKNTIVAAAALLLASSAAGSAADMAFKAPVPSAIFNWSGFYFGVHAGWGGESNPWTFRGAVEDPTMIAGNLRPTSDGVLGGVQAGANYQFANWVVGIETDVSVLRAKGSDNGTLVGATLPPPNGITTTATSQIEWLALFTGRIGYAWDRTLFYVKGGVAGGGTKDNFILTQNAPQPSLDFGTKTNVNVGGTIGAGIEHAFAPHWSTKIEYNYIDLGKNSENFSIFALNSSLTFREDINHRLHILKVGANYRF